MVTLTCAVFFFFFFFFTLIAVLLLPPSAVNVTLLCIDRDCKLTALSPPSAVLGAPGVDVQLG